MKFKLITTAILSFLLLSGFGQNQVINPSFETFDHSLLVSPFPITPGGKNYLSNSTNYLPPPYTERNTTDPVVFGCPHVNCYARTGYVSVALVALTNNTSHTTNPYREYIVGETNSLNAGVRHKVEFWARKETGSANIKLGANMSPNPNTAAPGSYSSPLFINPTIERDFVISNFQYTRVVGYWSPSTTGKHYITIGSFRAHPLEGKNDCYFYVDDLNVTPCPLGSGNPNPIVSISQSSYCIDDPIIVTASTSANIAEYNWTLFEQGTTVPLKKGFWNTGIPGQLDVQTFYNSLIKGKCYTLELEAAENCSFKKASVNFCIEDPNVSIVPFPSDVCEGTPVNLQLIGDPRWMYTWSNGMSGIGLTGISVTPNLFFSNYTVTVTTTAGCSSIGSFDLNVHPKVNVAPYVNGIDNFGEYIAYVNAENNICLNIPSFDNLSEEVKITWDNGIPGATFSRSGLPHETGRFCWNPTKADIGFNSFVVTVEDNNACGNKKTSYIFKVKVVCDHCPLAIYYENRPFLLRLPAKTEAGEKIIAGENVDSRQVDGPVYNTSGTSTEFKAPKILLKPGFTGKNGFHAIAYDETCTDLCEDCCDDWTGFTYDPIPNVITPNGDGVNDFWYLGDQLNPYCAFNAKGFDLRIYNRWGTVIKHLSYSGTDCCPFQAPSPDNPIKHSSIFWDGKTNGGDLVSDGVYFFTLTLEGCGEEEHFEGNITVFGDGESDNTSNSENTKEKDSEILLKEPKIYPNPALNIVNVELINEINKIEIHSSEGKLLFTKNSTSKKEVIDLSVYSKGTYFIKISNEKSVFVEKIIKN